jgi:hypothetical protein
MHTSELSPRPVAARTPDASPTRSQKVRVASLTHQQAERLLDWLENHGCTGVEVETDKDGRFTVRFTPKTP